MADTQVLGTCVFGREGSSPFSRTSYPRISENHLKISLHALYGCIGIRQRCLFLNDRSRRSFDTVKDTIAMEGPPDG